MEGKIIVTNTTPVLSGRSFGTNAFEAAITAAAGLGRTLTFSEIGAIIEKENIKPQIRKL